MVKIKQSISFFLLITCLLSACSSSRNMEQVPATATAGWQANTLVADGNDNEWIGNMAFYNEKLKMGYSITSDASTLYIRIRTTNEQTQQQILRGGLTVLINSHGVKDEHGAAGISFPTGNPGGKDNTLSGRPELSNNINIALSNVKDYSLFGFTTVKTVENYDYGRENPEHIEVGIGLNSSHALVYEAAIPFSAVYNESGAINAPGRSIAIGFVLDVAPSQQGRGNGRGSGISFGGGFGLGSFGSGGGMGLSIGTGALGGGRQGGGALKQDKIWREIVLAKVPAQK